MRKIVLLMVVLTSLLLPSLATAQSETGQPVVQAVLFYSPTCPHCHEVIKNLLIPMIDEYGDQLQIVGIDTTQAEGGQLYQNAIEHYQIPPERRGVPTLIVGEVVLVGSGEIPAEFPTIVQDNLAADGISWPNIPGFAPELVAEDTTSESDAPSPTAGQPETEPAAPAGAAPEPTTEAPASQAETGQPAPVANRDTQSDEAPITDIDAANISAEPQAAAPPDPVGMTLAIAVLLGMAAALVFAVWRVMTGQMIDWLAGRDLLAQARSWLIPLLSLLGLGVSLYLAYVEINQVEAICGPVGHCNLVQSSAYAHILGIPIAVLGVLNYIVIVLLWAAQRIEHLTSLSVLSLLGLTFFGTLFSIYLTLLEILVIQAICAWCLSSAIITTALLLLVVAPVTRLRRLQETLSY